MAFLLRVLDLNSLPGLNGDEAWYGVQIERFQALLPIVVRAPSGRVSSNVFMVALLYAVQEVAGPAIWVLRVPTVIAGVVTVWLAFVGLRAVWGRTVALSTALILACLPINIAYSRFGWDPSMLGPFLVAAIALAARGRGIAATFALAAAVVVHPTAVFALPVIWGLILGTDRTPGERWWHSTLARWGALFVAAVGLYELTRRLSGARQSVELSVVVERLTDLGQAWDFIVHLFSLFSGRSVYAYFVSADEPAAGWLILERCALVATLVVLVVGLSGAIARRSWRDVGLLGGTSVSLGLLYLSSGVAAVRPEGGRYAVYAVPAVVLSFVVALRHSRLLVVAGWQRYRGRGEGESAPFGFRSGPRAAIAGTLVLSVTLLTITVTAYFQPLRVNGSTTHEAFLTADVDPRQQAWQIVAAQLEVPRPGTDRATVYCEDWWICYPLEYFAGAGTGAPIITPMNKSKMQTLSTAQAGDLVVVRSGGPLNWSMNEKFRTTVRSGPGSPARWFVVDRRGRPGYTVFRL